MFNTRKKMSSNNCVHRLGTQPSEIRGLCLIRYPREMVKNLPFLAYKNKYLFSYFILCNISFYELE